MLRAGWIDVRTEDLGTDGLKLALRYDYDLILLDLDLPDIHGYEIVHTLRKEGNRTPIIILTGDSRLESKVRGLMLGADDYVTKPFHKDELVARIYSNVRRYRGHVKHTIEIGKLRVDIMRQQVWYGEDLVFLTKNEYRILELLATKKNELVSREQILDHLYQNNRRPESKIIDVYISKIRKKIFGRNGHQYLENIWGRGYKLQEPQEATA